MERSNPDMPQSSRTIQAIDEKVRRGDLSPTQAFLKTQKALEKALAKKVPIEKDLERQEGADAVDRAARASRKRT